MRSPHIGRGCGDSKQTDTALFLLARLWQTGEAALRQLLTTMNVVCRLLSASMSAEGMHREAQ